MPRLPSFSIVLEWENARLAGAERASLMLRELVCQAREISSEVAVRPELILLYEKEEVPHDAVEQAVNAACGSDAPFDVRYHATEGAGYYGQKNEGAQLARHEYILLLDSDVVPEPGWLRALVGSLGPGVNVVGGTTYVDTQTFFGRAFGLFWFFPVRTEARGLKQVRYFYANNVMFRRDLFLAYRFADLPLYRGQCKILADGMRENGVRIFQQTGARVSHAPPNPRHFVHRALSEGHDAVMLSKLAGRSGEVGRVELRNRLAHYRDRVNGRRPFFSVGRAETVAAHALARAYCLLRFAGQRWAIRSPEGAQRALGIPTHPLPATIARPLRLQEARQQR